MSRILHFAWIIKITTVSAKYLNNSFIDFCLHSLFLVHDMECLFIMHSTWFLVLWYNKLKKKTPVGVSHMLHSQFAVFSYTSVQHHYNNLFDDSDCPYKFIRKDLRQLKARTIKLNQCVCQLISQSHVSILTLFYTNIFRSLVSIFFNYFPI